MKLNPVILLFLIIITAFGCNNQTTEVYTNYYRAVNGSDTADLKLSTIGNHFYGQFEIRKNWYTYRTGNIEGKIMGDTLIGDFYYKPFSGGAKKRMPFALLKRDDALHIGNGLISSYMGVPFFVPSVPITYDSAEFVLVKVEKELLDSVFINRKNN